MPAATSEMAGPLEDSARGRIHRLRVRLRGLRRLARHVRHGGLDGLLDPLPLLGVANDHEAP